MERYPMNSYRTTKQRQPIKHPSAKKWIARLQRDTTMKVGKISFQSLSKPEFRISFIGGRLWKGTPFSAIRFVSSKSNKMSGLSDHWSNQVKALGASKVPATTKEAPPYPTTESNIVPHTGFLNLKVKHPEQQKKQDAMSGSWEGVSASDAAIANGLFKADFMPVQSSSHSTK